MAKKKKVKDCFTCPNGQYIGDGDTMCDITGKIVCSSMSPTDDYLNCEGV